MKQIINISSRVIYSLLFYVLLMVLVFVSKPSIMFEKNGDIKAFGIGDDKTMFSLGVITSVIAILSFYTFCVIDIVFKQ